MKNNSTYYKIKTKRNSLWTYYEVQSQTNNNNNLLSLKQTILNKVFIQVKCLKKRYSYFPVVPTPCPPGYYIWFYPSFISSIKIYLCRMENVSDRVLYFSILKKCDDEIYDSYLLIMKQKIKKGNLTEPWLNWILYF